MKTTIFILFLILTSQVFPEEMKANSSDSGNPFFTELKFLGIDANILIDLVRNEEGTDRNNRIRCLKMLFVIGYSLDTDASTTEGYSSIISNLLKGVGDDLFSNAVSQLPEEAKKFTLNLIIIEYGIDKENVIDLANSKLEFEKSYPQLYKQVSALSKSDVE